MKKNVTTRINIKKCVTNRSIEIIGFFIFLGLPVLLSTLKTTISVVLNKCKPQSPPSYINERYQKSPMFVQYFWISNLFQTKIDFIWLTNLPKRKINREIILPKTLFLLKKYMSLSLITPVFSIVKFFYFISSLISSIFSSPSKN